MRLVRQRQRAWSPHFHGAIERLSDDFNKNTSAHAQGLTLISLTRAVARSTLRMLKWKNRKETNRGQVLHAFRSHSRAPSFISSRANLPLCDLATCGAFRMKIRQIQKASDFIEQTLAGDAVQIAPVSSQIPCKQGILQGKSRFWASRRQSQSKKPPCRRDFSANSLSKLSGIVFRRTGNSKRITGIFRGRSVSVYFLQACLAANIEKPYPRPF